MHTHARKPLHRGRHRPVAAATGPPHRHTTRELRPLKPYPRPGGFEGLFPPTQADRIIGQDEGKRSTKTFIRGEKSAIILALIKNHADNHARAIQSLHHRERCPERLAALAEATKAGLDLDLEACRDSHCPVFLSRDDMREMYPGVRGWDSVHQELVEHYASLEGFSLRVVARVVQMAQDADRLTESSLKQEGRAGDGKTNGVVKPAT